MTTATPPVRGADDVARSPGAALSERIRNETGKRGKGRTVRPLRRLWPFVRAYPAQLAAFCFFLLLASVLTLALPAAFRFLLDCGYGVSIEGVGDGLTSVCGGIGDSGPGGRGLSIYFLAGMGVALALGAAMAARFYFISRLGERVVADLRSAVYARLMALNPRAYADLRTGEILSRLTTDTTLIQTLVGSSISVALRTSVTTIGALILMVIVNWRLAAIVLAAAPLLIFPALRLGNRIQRLSRASQDTLARASMRASEGVSAIQTVQAFTQEKAEIARFDDALEATFQVSMKRILVRTVMLGVLTAGSACGLIGMLWFGAVQVQSGATTPGAMAQFVLYAFTVVSGVGLLSEVYAEIMRAAGATERLVEILDLEPEIAAPATPAIAPAPFEGRLAFNDVRFAYPQRANEQALDGVSFNVNPGETVALVGPSGAGKSTIFQLLLRFYDPTAGRITIDGLDIKSLDPLDLRSAFAVVQQNAPLFSGDVTDNIRYGRPEASDADVRAAAEAADDAQFIDRLPERYETPLGEGSNQLSGGQRQRLSIARAILRDAPILLLDEATSALDSESERAVQAAFQKISEDRTTLVIAHRLSTVLNADRILVLENGRIVDQGDHETLMARGGLYARFAEIQFGSPKKLTEAVLDQ
ncbi:MAG: ABC transporter transmembrane domain-containing protein [Pseudomonadota bacterium]